MADFATSAREYICDAPDCKVRRLVAGNDQPDGFTGTVSVPDIAGQDWFACKATHIRPAVEHVVTPVDQLTDADREASQWKRDLAADLDEARARGEWDENARAQVTLASVAEQEDTAEAEAFDAAMATR